VLIVMSGLHVLVARYDLLVSSTADCIFNTSASCAPTESPPPSSQPTEASTGSPEPPTPAPSIGPEVSQPSLPPWDGKQRLNILLIGADEQGGGHRTDTMIVVSIDPKTNEVVMFQLPRDTVDVPVPPGPARQLFGSVFGGKINAYLSAVSNRPDLYPGKGLATGYNGLKAILGGLYGIDIPYFVEVNFSGFRQVVDALGGVTINVQVPITDDRYPGSNGDLLRLYIPAGVQHFDGAGALQYARSRHNSSDFDRAARQQRILVSLRRQVDIQQILPNLDSLAAAISHSITTDIPRELVPQLLSLAQQVDTKTIRSVIFTPPYYQTQCLNCTLYKLEPNIARIRAAVKDAFQVDPGFAEARDAIAGEGATVWVLNGSGRPGQASSLATYLNYLGMAATAPTQKPDTTGLSGTTIRAYNGAEESFPLTIAALEQQLGVTKVELVTDPTVSADIVVITAKNTPQLTAPPRP
jgi:LCP family protein required for cell wall assembly